MSRKGWTSPPSVSVVSGSDEFLRSREVRRAKEAAETTKRRVVTVDVGDVNGIEDIIMGSDMFVEPCLLVVPSASLRKKRGKAAAEEAADEAEASGWDEAAVELIAAHAAEKDTPVAILVVHAGDIGTTSFAAKIVKANPKIMHLSFTAPDVWEAGPYAEKFLMAEMVRREKIMSADVAHAIVSQVGTDLGQLSFEALKFSTYLDAVGGKEATVAIVRPLYSAFGPKEYTSLVTAVGNKNIQAVLREVKRLQEGPAGDVGIPALARSIGTTAVSWLQVSTLLDKNMTEAEIGERLAMKVGRIHHLALIARRWGTKGLVHLIRGLANADRGVFLGHIAPWVELECELIRACDPGSVSAR